METTTKTNWAHTHDVWGVLIDQQKAGENSMDIFRQHAVRYGTAAEQVSTDIENYRKVLEGTAGANRAAYIQALAKVVDKICESEPEIRAGKIKVLEGLFYPDTIASMQTIMDGGDYVAFFTTKTDKEVMEALSNRFPQITGHKRYVGVEEGRKSVEAFKEVGAKLGARGYSLVSHTEDEIHLARAARDSDVYRGNQVYVDRKNEPFDQEGLARERIVAVRDLRDVDYRSLINHL